MFSIHSHLTKSCHIILTSKNKTTTDNNISKQKNRNKESLSHTTHTDTEITHFFQTLHSISITESQNTTLFNPLIKNRFWNQFQRPKCLINQIQLLPQNASLKFPTMETQQHTSMASHRPHFHCLFLITLSLLCSLLHHPWSQPCGGSVHRWSETAQPSGGGNWGRDAEWEEYWGLSFKWGGSYAVRGSKEE